MSHKCISKVRQSTWDMSQPLVLGTQYTDLSVSRGRGILKIQLLQGTLLWFYPHFSTFPLMWLHVPLALTSPTHMPQHVPPNHGTYPRLRCTHMHYPIHPCSCLVPYSCAEACQNNSDRPEHWSRHLDAVLRSSLQPPVFTCTVFHTDAP